MQKRGLSPLFFLFELLAAVVIIFAMITIAKNVATSDFAKQEFFIKDTALVVDTLHAMPGDVVFNYKTINFTEEATLDVGADFMRLQGPFGSRYNIPFRAGVPSIFVQKIPLAMNKESIIIFEKKDNAIVVTRKEEQP